MATGAAAVAVDRLIDGPARVVDPGIGNDRGDRSTGRMQRLSSAAGIWQSRNSLLHEDTAMSLQPFHLAFPVTDLAAAQRFYGEVLGCREGRSSASWIDFDFFGHQLVAHLTAPAGPNRASPAANLVDGDLVPVPHFGVVLEMSEWHALAARLQAAGTRFIIEPHTRFAGETGEQATMFFLDPAGNALEFKAFAEISQLFAV